MLTLQLKTTRLTVTEANAAKYRAIIDSGKLPKHKIKVDPKHSVMRRDYPAFYPGMETSEYLSRYASMNNRLLLSAWKYDHSDRAAPVLDATHPEVLEEMDPDYVEQPRAVKASKTRRPGPAELRLALSCILDVEPDQQASVHDLWLALGEIRKIAKHMLEA